MMRIDWKMMGCVLLLGVGLLMGTSASKLHAQDSSGVEWGSK